MRRAARLRRAGEVEAVGAEILEHGAVVVE